MRILVTGSSGMIGTALVKSLLKEGHEVIGLDIRQPQEKSRHLFIKHDLRNPISARRWGKIKKPDLIIHLAANARVYQLVVDPVLEDLAGNSVCRVFDRDLSRPEDDPGDGGPVRVNFRPR